MCDFKPGMEIEPVAAAEQQLPDRGHKRRTINRLRIVQERAGTKFAARNAPRNELFPDRNAARGDF